MLARALFTFLLGGAAALADPSPLVSGDPLDCFKTIAGALTRSTVTVDGMPFASALRLKTGDVPATANAWDIRARCFSTLAARQDDVVAVTFWMRAIAAPGGLGLTSFVLERKDSPYTKSVTYTAAAGLDWKKFEVPFTMAESYAASDYNLSFWVTFPNQEIEIGGIGILDYGPGVPFADLNLSTWPYAERAADAPWRAAAAARIDRYRKGDLAVIVRDDNGNPIPGAKVHVKMTRHAFGFGTAVAGAALQNVGADGQKYRDALKKLFNKVVTENVLKWPPFETWGRAQADYMLPWFADKDNGFAMVRGHNVIWPGAQYLPDNVQIMLKANPVDADALRARVNQHIADVMAYTKRKVTEWDVLNEAYTNKDLQAVLGDAEMTSWFQQARAADPTVKLYINDYNILEAGGYDLQHINGYAGIIQSMLDSGAPIDGIGLQSHFDSNLTAPSRVLELIDRFAAFGKDLQVTEFDVSIADEQVQADYTRDFLTVCFSHPAMKGFMIWGFWEGAHWNPQAAMIRLDWSTKPNYDAWYDLIYRQWWTDTSGVTASDGVFRTRGFLGDYEVTVDGGTSTYKLTLASNTEPAYVHTGKTTAGAIKLNGVVNAASYGGDAVAPGEIVTIFGSGLGPATPAVAQYTDGQLPTSAGETRVLFDGTAAPMIYASAGQVSAIVPYTVRGTAQVRVEYQGMATPPATVPVAPAAPGIFTCPNKTALVINDSAGGVISCNGDFVPPAPGSVITFFITGDGVPAPAIADGRLPSGPPYAGPAAPWSVNVGGIDAPLCPDRFAGLVYAGVTQVNACIPDGVPRTADVPITFRSGAATSAPAGIDLRLPR